MDWQWHKGALRVTKLVSVFHRKSNEELYLDDAIGNRKKKKEGYSHYHV